MELAKRRAARMMVACCGIAAGGLARGQTLSWLNVAGGTASTAGNWNPAAVPGAANDLVWNLNNTFGVTFNASTTASRTHAYRRGIVTLTASSPHTVSNGITIGDTNALTGTVILASGTFNSTSSVTLGSAAGSAGVLNVTDDSSDLNITGAAADLTVGLNGPGTLSITGGGLVSVADQFVAGSNSAGTSTVTVSGAQSFLPFQRSRLLGVGTSQSRFGQGGDATINITNGALAQFSGSLVVSNGSLSTSVVTVAGLGGLANLTHATLDVAGDVLLGRNTTAGTAGGVATMNINDSGTFLIDGTLFVAGDPDGGTATLHMATRGLITTHSLALGTGATLDLDGGAMNIDGGTFSNTNIAGAPSFGGVNHPVITMVNGATASLAPVSGVALRVGAGAGANRADFDVRGGSDLTITGGDVVIGEGADDAGSMIINGAGSSVTLPTSGSFLSVGGGAAGGDGQFEAEQGAVVSGDKLEIGGATNATAALFESLGTTATFNQVFIGGNSVRAGGSGDLILNDSAVFTVRSPGGVVRVWPLGEATITNAVVNASTATVTVEGDLDATAGGVLNALQLNVLSGGRLVGGSNTTGTGTINAQVALLIGSSIDLVNGDLVIGNNTSTSGFISVTGSVINIGARHLTILDRDASTIGSVTLAGGTFFASKQLNLLSNATIIGTGTITTPALVITHSGGATITATGANGITFNGLLSDTLGNISGTKFTFNGPNGGKLGSGNISARAVFNADTKLTATGNMTAGFLGAGGLTFNAGSELHAGVFNVTLVDGSVINLPTLTDLDGGQISTLQPLTVPTGRTLEGHGTIQTPSLTIFGDLRVREYAPDNVARIVATGSLTFGSGSSAFFDIFGEDLDVVEYDRLTAVGPLAIPRVNATIHVAFANGFVPTPGNLFPLMTGSSRTGEFAIHDIPPHSIIEYGSNYVALRILCPADFNEDGFVDFFDYDAFVECFEGGACPPGASVDFNRDGFVDFFDYDDFVLAFETGC